MAESNNEQCRSDKENYDSLLSVFHIGTQVKRCLLEYFLKDKKLDLFDWMTNLSQNFLQFEDVQRAVRRSSLIQVTDLEASTIDNLLTNNCYEMFWDVCLFNSRLEDILNYHVGILSEIYHKERKHHNVPSLSTDDYMPSLTRSQWELLFETGDKWGINAEGCDHHISASKDITVSSLDKHLNFLLLWIMCPLFKSVNTVSECQMQIIKIAALQSELEKPVFRNIWQKIETNILNIGTYCNLFIYFERECIKIKKAKINRSLSDENRECILEDAFKNPRFIKDRCLCECVRKELDLNKYEYNLKTTSKLCDGQMPLLLVEGKLRKGAYLQSVLQSAESNLHIRTSVCSSTVVGTQQKQQEDEIPKDDMQKRIERHNYLKLVFLISHIAKDVLVYVLKCRLPGANFKHAFMGIKNLICQYLNNNERQLLYPHGSSYNGDLSDLDISLIYIILRNLNTIPPHDKDWGNMPNDDDRGLSANIDRIRIFKNTYVSHCSECSINDEEFQKTWKQIRQCIIQIGGQEYESKIDFLLTSEINPVMEMELCNTLARLKEAERQNRIYISNFEDVVNDIQRKLEMIHNDILAYAPIPTGSLDNRNVSLELVLEGEDIPSVQEIETLTQNSSNDDLRIKYVKEGSIIIGLEVSISAFYKVGYFLGLIDGLLASLLQRHPRYGHGHTSKVFVSLDFMDIDKDLQAHDKTSLHIVEDKVDSLERVDTMQFGKEESNTLMHRSFLGERQTRKEKIDATHHEYRNTQGAPARNEFLDEQYDSIWLFEVLNSIGVNDKFRKICQHAALTTEIIDTFNNSYTCYLFGSACDGTVTPGEPNKVHFMKCDERWNVIEDIAKADMSRSSLLIVREVYTPAGYVKLQFVIGGVPCTSVQWPFRKIKGIFKTDPNERIVLSSSREADSKNKPAIQTERYYISNADMVIAYRCKTWPTMAKEWLSRQRYHGWPTEDTIQELVSLGFFVVKKGHPISEEKDLEWRISFSLQERKLFFNLTDVQHKCYVVLRMLNRNIINIKWITSYHWKTCLFYVIENNSWVVWEQKFLFHCIKLCIKQMLKWVKYGVCPSYFIPGENLFDGRLNDSWRLIFENILNEILTIGFDCLLWVKTNNICDYVRSRRSLELLQMLQTHSERVYIETKCMINIKLNVYGLFAFNYNILEHYDFNVIENITTFINFLWHTIAHIQHIETISEHTTEETKLALSLLTPHIYVCLASNISAMAIQQPNPQVRDFLLLGSFVYLTKGGLSGRLKLISALYAVGLYEDCEWYLNQFDEECVKNNPSVCPFENFNLETKVYYFMKYTTLNVSPCVSFLPTELPIVPDALKYEMFRFWDIPSKDKKETNLFRRCQYRAAVESNIFFFLLKFLIKGKLKSVKDSHNALHSILYLLVRNIVGHRDVVCNLVVWMLHSNGDTPLALQLLPLSWKITNILNSFSLINTVKLYHSKAAELHALVIMYNTWFVGKRSRLNFCFQCFYFSHHVLYCCSRCRKAFYCSKRCQRINWEMHKAVCKIVRKYHIV